MFAAMAGAATGGEEAEEAPTLAELRLPCDAALVTPDFVTEAVLLADATEPSAAPAEERLPLGVGEIEAAPA